MVIIYCYCTEHYNRTITRHNYIKVDIIILRFFVGILFRSNATKDYVKIMKNIFRNRNVMHLMNSCEINILEQIKIYSD